ncbi:MAG: amino acid permease [Planctomycetes bacterium]|jgi:APA family basic amino acid/polyamine antiporter|nr:amino acid permease [Planctomycetota bacterium]
MPQPATPASKSPGKPTSLKREVGIFGAILLGLGSILGTGVFVSLGIAAGVAGPAVVLAVVIAAVLAMCNGISSAQLAAAHPVSGGTYEYGYRYLHPNAGRVAGWMFLCAKSASAATAALGFAGYLVQMITPGEHADWSTPLALLGIVVLTGIVLAGIRRTNAVNLLIVGLTVGTLIFFIIGVGVNLEGEGVMAVSNFGGLENWENDRGQTFWPALLHGSALVFVAFTGYGRVATLGEEITDPRKSIPIAVVLTVLVSAALYFGVAFVAVAEVGAYNFSAYATEGHAPLERIARGIVPWWRYVLAIGAITAMVGVLLNLILGLSRVALAMGRRRDLPGVFAKINDAGTTPVPAVLLVAAIIFGLAAVGSVAFAWSFSATTVLIYYALTNLAALRLPPEDRRFPRLISVAGLIGCLGLCVFIDWPYLVAAGMLLVVIVVGHALAARFKKDPQAEG